MRRVMHQVAVEALDRLVVEVEGEVRVLDALALGGEQLDELGSGTFLVRSEDLTEAGTKSVVGHAYSLVSSVFRDHRHRQVVSAGRATGCCVR